MDPGTHSPPGWGVGCKGLLISLVRKDKIQKIVSENGLPIGLLAAPFHMLNVLVACGELPFRAVNLSALSLPPYRCPYGLPAIDSGDTVVVSYLWLREQCRRGIEVISQILTPLRQRFRRILGFDHSAPFFPALPNDYISEMDVVLKTGGIYRDLELYQFLVGTLTSDGNWSEKREPGPERFTSTNLRRCCTNNQS